MNANSSTSFVQRRVQFDLPPLSEKSEKEDSLSKIKIEKLQSDVDGLTNSLQESQDALRFHKDRKDELVMTVESLSERIEIQNTGAQNVWSKLPVVVAALKRLDDETFRLRRERLDSETERKNLNRTIDYLREDNDERLEDISTLRTEVEALNQISKEVELK